MFFAGDSAGHCLPLSGEGIRTAFYFGIAAGRRAAGALDGEQTREQALARLRRVLPRAPPAFTLRAARCSGRSRASRRAR